MLPLYTLPVVYIQYCYRRRMVAIPSAASWSLSPFSFLEDRLHVQHATLRTQHFLWR